VHTAMIVLHAAAGVLAFVAGCLVLRPPDAGPRAQRLFQVYLVSLGSMVVFLVGAMAAHWRELGTTEQVVYGGLLLLGLFMVWRAMAAGSVLRRRGDGWRLPYMEHVGFTLIALWDGFVIVLAHRPRRTGMAGGGAGGARRAGGQPGTAPGRGEGPGGGVTPMSIPGRPVRRLCERRRPRAPGP
jgi:hypothetical protein